MRTLLIAATLAAVGLSGATAQTAPGNTAGSGTTNGAMQPDSTGTIGAMHSSSTDPAAGGSAPAGASSDGMTMVDGKYMMNGKPATKAQIAKHKKMEPQPN